MTYGYKSRWLSVGVPTLLILSGCANSSRTERSAERRRPSSTRTATMVAERGNDTQEYPRNEPYRSELSSPKDAQHDVTLDQIRQYVRNRSAVLVDARSPEGFDRSHLRGAINLPAGEIERYLPRFVQAVDRDKLVVVYCGGPTCHASDMVAEYLVSQGYTHVQVFTPGWQTLSAERSLL